MSTTSLSGLRILLGGFVIGWFFFAVGMYLTTMETTFEYSIYLMFAAITSLGIAALIAKRRAIRALGGVDPHSASVNVQATTGIIVAMVLCAWAMVALFIALFTTEYTSATVRVVNTYIPIVLFTTILVALLLYGFVFTTQPAPAATLMHSAAHHAAPTAPLDNRTNALAYAIPIIGGAIAAIVAGIIYDVTGTRLTAWIWMIVVGLVAIGLVLGTHFSSRLSRPAGAHGLNVAWTIALAAVVGIMSLGFTAGAVSELRAYASLTISIYPHAAHEPGFEVTGNGLKPNSEVVISLDGQQVNSHVADRDGWIWIENNTDVDFPAGDSELTVSATTTDGFELVSTASVNRTDDMVTPTDDSGSYSEHIASGQITGAWLASYLLPAFLMALTVVLVLYTTELQRGRVRARVLTAPVVEPTPQS